MSLDDVTSPATSSRQTVLIFRKRLLPWSETFIAQQARALRRYNPVFVGYTEESSGLGYIEGADRHLLSRHGVPGVGRAFFKLTGRMPRGFIRALARREPRLVHAHFGTSIPPAASIARALGIPLLVTFHGHDIATVPRTEEAAEKRRKRIARVDHAIAVSEFIARRVRESGCPPERITLHRIGVDTDYFTPPSAARDPHTVLFVGRLVPKKGLAHLLRAFPAIVERVPGARLLAIGDGPLRSDMEELARSLNVPVRFTGVLKPDEIRSHMRTAVLLAAPSIETRSGDAEGLPITIMEAAACGLPVVASPSGGSAEGVLDGSTGFLVPPGDEAAIADRIVRLLGDSAVSERMAGEARRFALDAFSLERQTALLEDIYDRVAGGLAVTSR